MKTSNIKVYWIDLFAGAGGTTSGIQMSDVNASVIACVNHDPEAIKCHKENYPECIHFTEDIRDFNVVIKLKKIVDKLRKDDPSCIINLWASLECTNHSKAKGGLARDGDSRTLANDLTMYIEELNPTYIYIENVEEFMIWGEIDENGKPIVELKGTDYRKWVSMVQSYDYQYDYRLLNSADFGALTSRKRYFGVFAKGNFPIVFPEKTHIKKGKENPGNLKPWKSIRGVLDLEDHGRSIFGLTLMNRPYSEKTIKRVHLGLDKFTNEDKFLTSYYGNGNAHSIDAPCNTLTTKERYAIHHVEFHKIQWTFDTQFGNTGRSIDQPGQTLIARMDKKPIYLCTADREVDNSIELPTDNQAVKDIKACMRAKGIKDIKIRMLKVPELKTIQGFPDYFNLTGTKANKLKFIGNSVEPNMAKVLIEANYNSLVKYINKN